MDDRAKEGLAAEAKSIIEGVYTQTQQDTAKAKLESLPDLLTALDPEALQKLLKETEDRKQEFLVRMVEDEAAKQDKQYQDYLEVQKAIEKAELLQKYKEYIESKREHITKVQDRFDSNVKELREELSNDTSVIKSLTQNLKEGKEVDEKLLDQLVGTEISSEKKAKSPEEKIKEIYADRDEINKQHTELNEEAKKFKEEINLIKEKLKNPELKIEEKKELQHNLSISEEKLKQNNDFAKMVGELQEKNDTILKDVQKDLQAKGKEIDEFGKIISEKHKKEPEKYEGLKQKHGVLKEQHEKVEAVVKQENEKSEKHEKEQVVNKLRNNLESSASTVSSKSQVTPPPSTPSVPNNNRSGNDKGGVV